MAVAPLDRLVARQGHVLTVEDFVATLVTEATIHGLDLAAALDRAPWSSAASLSVTRATLEGLGAAPPATADLPAWIRATTGRPGGGDLGVRLAAWP